jgi:RNA recognition motif-containing protein
MGTRLYVGNLNERADKPDLEDTFSKYGTISDIWVAR